MKKKRKVLQANRIIHTGVSRREKEIEKGTESRNVIQNKYGQYFREHGPYAVFMLIECMMVMLFRAYNNSPLIKNYGEDGGIFLLMGRGMLQGKELYTDLFDHKGPVIFVINAIGQLLFKGATGVWILEILAMFLSMLLLYRIGYRLTGYKAVVIIALLYACAMGCTMNGGNYTEEYSNLFTILSLSIFTTWLETKELPDKTSLPNKKAFLLGMFFALTFFMRPNNMALIMVIIAYIFIDEIRHKSKDTFRCLLMTLFGCFLVSGLIICYHYIHGTLGEMMNATIWHNIKYSMVRESEFYSGIQINSLFCIVLILCDLFFLYTILRLWVKKERRQLCFLIPGAVILNMSMLTSGRSMIYYLMQMWPLIAYACILVMRLGDKDFQKFICNKRKSFILILFTLMILIGVNLKGKADIKGEAMKYQKDSIALCELVPEEEKNEIFGYDVPALWYYCNEIMPPFRYFTMQSWMSDTDPRIDEAILKYIKEEKPDWIVTYFSQAVNNSSVKEIILSDYEEAGENSSGYLYKRRK